MELLKKILCLLVILNCFGCVDKRDDSVIRMAPPERFPVKQTSLQLGIDNFYGDHSCDKVDFNKARYYFEQVDKDDLLDYGVSCYYLGQIYGLGLGKTTLDYNKSQNYYRKAFDILEANDYSNHPYALLIAGEYYQDKELLKGAMDLGANEAKFKLAKLEDNQEITKKLLISAMSHGYPEAYYQYAIRFATPTERNELLKKSAQRHFADAIILFTSKSNNKIAIEQAHRQCLSLGKASSFYYLAKENQNILEKNYLMRQASLRGNIESLEYFANYYEQKKLWIKSIVYNNFLNQQLKRETSIEIHRLDEICGLNYLVKKAWQDRSYAELNLLDSDIEYFIKNYKSDDQNFRKSYQDYLLNNRKEAYMSFDWFHIFKNDLPLSLASDIFKFYQVEVEPDSIAEQTFFFNYAIVSGYAKQSELIRSSLKEIKYSQLDIDGRVIYHLLMANSLAISSSSNKAVTYLKIQLPIIWNGRIDENYQRFITNFANSNAPNLLEYREDLAKIIDVDVDKFAMPKFVKKQQIYNLFTGGDTDAIVKYAEPALLTEPFLRPPK